MGELEVGDLVFVFVELRKLALEQELWKKQKVALAVLLHLAIQCRSNGSSDSQVFQRQGGVFYPVQTWVDSYSISLSETGSGGGGERA